MNKVLAADRAEYHAATKRLRWLLMALLEDGPFGAVFDGSSTHLDLTRPGGFDVSQIGDEDEAQQAAVQLACWPYGSPRSLLMTRMADLELAPRRRYLLIIEELWRLLRVIGPHSC